MIFTLFFDVNRKMCVQAKSPITPADCTPQKFAWIHYDLSDRKEFLAFCQQLPCNTTNLDQALQNDHHYFLHRQNLVINYIHICEQKNDRLLLAPLLCVLTDRLFLTACFGKNESIAKVLESCEESFKTVGKTPVFLYFLLWDSIIDSFFPYIFSANDQMDKLEEQLLKDRLDQSVLNDILGCKQLVRTLRQSLSPMQRILRHLVNIKLEFISDDAVRYLHGHFEHLDWLSQNIDSLQDNIHSTLEGYHSAISRQINNSMRLLAIIATLMMPLSLVAAIYGTNFPYVPEFNYKYSYFVFLASLLFLFFILTLIFRKKRWV